MSGFMSRRGFLWNMAAAGSSLAAPSWVRPGPAAQPAEGPAGQATGGGPAAIEHGSATGLSAPILVVAQAVSRDVNPRASAWAYIGEILRRAGLFFEPLSPADFPRLPDRSKAIVLLAGDLPLTAAQRQVLAAWVANGGVLVGIGGTSGLDEVFGVASPPPWPKAGSRSPLKTIP